MLWAASRAPGPRRCFEEPRGILFRAALSGLEARLVSEGHVAQPVCLEQTRPPRRPRSKQINGREEMRIAGRRQTRQAVVTLEQAIVLGGGGVVAGIVNTMAGGGSLVTVPLLIMAGLPGTQANATNRVAVFVQSAVAAWRFRAEGVSGIHGALPVLLPLMTGSALGAAAVSQLAAETFERIFGLLMLVLLVPTLRHTSGVRPARGRWSMRGTVCVFFAIGLYGGAFQAGVGLLLVLALARAGYGLLESNSIKVVVVAAFTLVAVAVFVWQDQVVWQPAAVLAGATSLGAVIGTRLAVRGGDALIRPVLAVTAMAGRLLGFY